MVAYLGVLVYIVLAVVLGLIILGLAFKVSPRRLDLEKNTAYECGFDPFGQARSPFDIEVAYLFPWALGGALTGWSGLGALILFLGVLVLGFVYEWQKGALDWNSFMGEIF